MYLYSSVRLTFHFLFDVFLSSFGMGSLGLVLLKEVESISSFPTLRNNLRSIDSTWVEFGRKFLRICLFFYCFNLIADCRSV